VKDYYTALLRPWAKKWHFNLDAFGVVERNRANSQTRSDDNNDCGDLALTAQYELEPSPISDTEDPGFSWLAGVIKGVFGEDVVVAPELLTGMYIKSRDIY